MNIYLGSRGGRGEKGLQNLHILKAYLSTVYTFKKKIFISLFFWNYSTVWLIVLLLSFSFCSLSFVLGSQVLFIVTDVLYTIHSTNISANHGQHLVIHFYQPTILFTYFHTFFLLCVIMTTFIDIVQDNWKSFYLSMFY